MTQTQAPEESSQRRKRLAIAGGSLTAILLGLIWWFGWAGTTEDPRLAEIRQLQESMAAKYPLDRPVASAMEAVERAAAVALIMGKVQALPENLRPEAMRAGQGVMRKRMHAKADAYFAMPAEHRREFLDSEIRQMEFMRKAFESGQMALRFFGAGGASSSGTAAGQSPGGQPRLPFGPPGGSEEDRNRWRKGMLDNTTADQRARMSEFIGAIQKRRSELGLPAMPGPP